MKNRGNVFQNPAVMLGLAALMGAGGLGWSLAKTSSEGGSGGGLSLPFTVPARPVSVVEAPAPTRSGMETLRELDQTFKGLAREVSEGVVSIQARGNMFGGQGSGFIYRPDGWIVTNDHVVSGSGEVTVILNDGRELQGEVFRANDSQIDLAVIKVDARDLPALPLANSREVLPGQYVMAVGAPFGLQNTVTIGHVSAIERGSAVNDPRFGTRAYSGLIQTDAAINPGNSGGPLLDIDGRVVGVNSTIVSSTGASAGIGFAIPSNVVRSVADELIETRRFDRGQLGAFIRDVKPFERKERNVAGGAFIEEVQEGGPAAAAGLQTGDIVTKIDGKPVETELDLRLALFESSPEKRVEVVYQRDGRTREAMVTLAAPERVQAMGGPRGEQFFTPEQMPDEMRERLRQQFGEMFGEGGGDREPSGPVRLGVGVRQVDDTARRQFGLPADVSGVLVTSVAPRSFAERIGMRVGDLITVVNGEEVRQVPDVARILEGVNWGDQVTVTYRRKSGSAWQTITQTRAIR